MIHVTSNDVTPTFTTTMIQGAGYGDGMVVVVIGHLSIRMPPEQAQNLASNLIAEADYLDGQKEKANSGNETGD